MCALVAPAGSGAPIFPPGVDWPPLTIWVELFGRVKSITYIGLRRRSGIDSHRLMMTLLHDLLQHDRHARRSVQAVGVAAVLIIELLEQPHRLHRRHVVGRVSDLAKSMDVRCGFAASKH